MTILRSREIPSLPNSNSSKTLDNGFIEPSTPLKTTEISVNRIDSTTPKSVEIRRNSTSVRRRSSRIASKKMNSEDAVRDSYASPSSRRRLNEDVVEIDCDMEDVGNEGLIDLNLGLNLGQESGVRVSDFDVMMTSNDSRNDAGKDKGKAIMIEDDDDDDDHHQRKKEQKLSLGLQSDGGEMKSSGRKFSREEKGKGVKLNDDDDVVLDNKFLNFDLNLSLSSNFYENDDVGWLNDVINDLGSHNNVIDDFGSHNDVIDDFGFELLHTGNDDERGLVNEIGVDPLDDVEAAVEEPPEMDVEQEKQERAKKKRERYKNIARRNAARLARYNAADENNPLNPVAEEQLPEEQPVGDLEDWPGPFTTALKIIRDREKKLKWKEQESSSVNVRFPLVSWVPKNDSDSWKKVPPTLQYCCLKVLSQNADALQSLFGIPDGMRNKLIRLLCDSRRMSPHVLGLLLESSPSELRLADCSWLEERVFENLFEACDTSYLTVLQLDLCGHCLSDISLRKALVSKGLPYLTTISLKGACRISDDGLASLVSSAPALTSVNLSQCSLLTDVGIDSIANSLGSTLQKLYLDYCDGLNTMRILPMLQQMKSLEVLSLRGLDNVTNYFISELVCTNGAIMKELILADCVKLTDASLKVIGEKCSQLCVLDLSNLVKLTDHCLLSITNGCPKIQDLNLCRCRFSDEAIAALLKVHGESLLVLSLNHIPKVAQNTTLSLADFCKNLESLDLSWCRSLTDEALGLIADSCLSLKLLKLFGCTQVSEVFVKGHSNPHLRIVGLPMTNIVEHIERPEFQ